MATLRPLEITLISAKDLKDVNLLSKMDLYVVATLSGDPRTRQRTPTDHDCGKKPTWNCSLKFFVPDDPVKSDLVLEVHIRCERVLGDRDVGEVHIPIKSLVVGAGPDFKFVDYQVRTPSGKAKGVLYLKYKFGEAITAAATPAPPPPPPYVSAPPPPSGYPPPSSSGTKIGEPVTAYPVAAGGAYPPPSSIAAYPGYPPTGPGYGYGGPPPPGYPPQGYPGYTGYGAPPPVGYGYPPPGGYPAYGPPPVQQPPRKNNFGLGLGAGLLGGALGGLLIGDAIGDIGGYDAGYDAGFDDGGGF